MRKNDMLQGKRRRLSRDLVLVTGGAGFIGSHVTDALLKKGYRVRVMDALVPPTHNGRLPSWFPKKAEFFHGDVRKTVDWKRALRGVSYVFHLAGYMDAHPDATNYFETNTISTARMFDVIREKKIPVKKIIAASSQSVYGEGKYRCARHGIQFPFRRPVSQLSKKDWAVRCPVDGRPMMALPEREDDRLVPVSAYGASKKTMEEVLHVLGRNADIPTVALRYTIVHGPRQSFRNFYSGALRQLAVMALSDQPLVLHEDANQIRDFVHIADIVRAHMVVLGNPRANGQTFTVGSGRKTRIRDLARMILRITGKRLPIQAPGLYRTGTARHSIADIRKLRALGWTPRKTLEDNVRDYVEWVRDYPEARRFLVQTLKKLKAHGTVRRA